MRLRSAVSTRALLAGLAAAAASSLVVPAAQADSPAINPTTVGTYPPLTNSGFNYYQAPGDYTFTWEFTANSPIQVTQLGYYDSGLAGTQSPNGFGQHYVSLIDVSTDTPLATADVTTDSPATGFFNYATITPVRLNTTDTYEVSGSMTNQYYLVGLNQAATPTAPQINYDFTPGNIFGNPAPAGTYADFGPNFQFATSCTENRPGKDVIALAGDVCTAAPGAYNPTTTSITLPVTYNGFGFYAHGGTINSPGAITITTSDPNGTGGSYGVWADTTGSQINLSGTSSITTAGARSHGVYASGGGQIVSTGALSVSTTGAGAIGIYASGTDSSITATLGSISTSAALTSAVQADGGASLKLTGGTVTTSGNGAWGLYSTGAGTTLSVTGVTVTTTGGVDPSGNVSLGAYAQQGSAMSLINTTIATRGAAAHGAEAGNASSITLSGGSVTTKGANAYGLFSTDTNSSIATSNGVTISTTGADSDGVLVISGAKATLSGGSVSTTGTAAPGLTVDGAGSTLTATGVRVSTTGDFDSNTGFQAQGVVAADYGVATLTNDTIVTTGTQGQGVLASTGGQVVISGGSVTVSGVDTDGLLANGAGSKITTSGGLVVTSTATPSANTLEGARADNSGALNLSATTISTSGAGVSGVGVETAGSATLNGVTLTTSGDAAHTITATGAGSTVILTGTNGLTTKGNGAVGIFAGSGGVVTGTGSVSITTSGTNALSNGLSGFGVNADGSGSSITLNSATIATSGEGAVGLLASDRNNTGAGGVITVNGALSVTTGATFAYDVYASAAGAKIAFDGTTTLNVGAGSFGLYATGGGVITTAGNLTIADANAGTGGGVEANSGSSITLGGTSKINLTSTNLVGLFAVGGSITSKAGLTIDAGANFGAIAQGGTINLGGTTTIATTGSGNTGVYASGGGGVTATALLSVSTTGTNATGVYASGAGSAINARLGTISTAGDNAPGAQADTGASLTLGDGTQISTTGEAAFALSASGSGSTATLNGAVTLNATGTAAAGVEVDNGGAVTVNGALTIKSAAYGVMINGNTGDSNSGAIVSVPGTLSLTTTSPTGAALMINGVGATFNGTGGGTINSAGMAINLTNGSNQTATFDNYTINSVSGDLIYADPTSATVNFNKTTANAGGGNLVDATGGSNITVNASASTLTGVIATDPTSTTTVNLANKTTWNLTSSSTVTNLNVNNSAIVFGPPGEGGFHTLTVNSYTGTGASITLNALLSGTNPGADQIVVNGGQAKGTTTIDINSLGTIGGKTSGLGIPVVTATNEGSIAPGAFTLATPVQVGGYSYSLQNEDGNEYLVSQVALSQSQANGSLASLAQSKESQAITNRVLGSILTGATEQMNCSSCSSGFASFGSFALGVHGRWTLTPNIEFLAGGSYDSYSAKGVSVNNSFDMAAALRYDMIQLGRYRPFFEAGIGAAPYADVHFSRNYVAGSTASSGGGSTLSQSLDVYGRVGYIFRLSRIDEAAVYTDLTRSWQHTDGYQELASSSNPFSAAVAPSLDTLNIWKIGGQYTHLFGEHIEANISAGYAQAFDADYGSDAFISGFGAAAGTAPSTFGWAELGGRLSYRFSNKLVGDAFVLGTVGAEPAGDQIHGGLALRLEF